MKASRQNRDQKSILEAYAHMQEAAGGLTDDVVKGALSKTGIKLSMSGSQMLTAFRNGFPSIKITPSMENLAKSRKLADKRKLVNLLTTQADTITRAADVGVKVVGAAGKMAQPVGNLIKKGAKPLFYLASGVGVYKVGGQLVDSSGNIISAGEAKLAGWIGAPGAGDTAAASATTDLEKQATGKGLVKGTSEFNAFMQAGQDKIKQNMAMGGVTGIFKNWDPETKTAAYSPGKLALGGLGVATAGIAGKLAYDKYKDHRKKKEEEEAKKESLYTASYNPQQSKSGYDII